MLIRMVLDLKKVRSLWVPDPKSGGIIQPLIIRVVRFFTALTRGAFNMMDFCTYFSLIKVF